MKVAALFALSVLVALPAEAAQRHHQPATPAVTCDNDGRCTTPSAGARTLGQESIEAASQNTTAAAPRHAIDANGNAAVGVVISIKTGAKARVGISYAARFQAYIDDLENNYGARVLFMGRIRPGHCSQASEHPCGKALDVGQRRRGVVDPRCNLPSRVALGRVAASHGLFEGGRWCNSDYGHVQIGVTAAACGDKIRIVQQ